MRVELNVSIVIKNNNMNEASGLWEQKLREIPDFHRYELVGESFSPGNLPESQVITRHYKLIKLQEMNS